MENIIRRVRDEPLNHVSTVIFALADLASLVSISLPYWLRADTDVTVSIGLLHTCVDRKSQVGNEDFCYSPSEVQPEWILTFLFMVIGIAGLTVATVANTIAFFKYPYQAQAIARFSGLVAIIFFNLAQIVFPAAFGQDQVGGKPFQLPTNVKIGGSYILFFISHWMAVIAELCAAKICRPRWQF